MFKKLAVASGISLFALSAFAVYSSNVKETIALTDGFNVYVFKDGKMGMEDKLGRSKRMVPGQVMVTKDGRQFKMVGDEVIRVDALKPKGA